MKILSEKCVKCLECVKVCPVQAISESDDKIVIDSSICLNCGCCASVCPNGAIEFE